MTKCPKCGDDNGWIYNEGYLCEKCKSNGMRMIRLVCMILGILGIFIGAFIGMLNFDYQKQKCIDLKSSQSNYDFDHKVEVNANYNSHCYFINNHPLALILHVSEGIVFGIMIPIFIGVIWGLRYV